MMLCSHSDLFEAMTFKGLQISCNHFVVYLDCISIALARSKVLAKDVLLASSLGYSLFACTLSK